MRCRLFRDIVTIFDVWLANGDIQVFQVEHRVHIAEHLVIGIDNILDVHIHKVIERINVLFD